MKNQKTAAAARIFAAWSQDGLIKEWWGPEGFTCPVADTDFKVGGKFLRCMRGRDGSEIWSTGEYLKIVPDREVINSDSRSNPEGAIIAAAPGEGGPFADATVSYITLELRAAEGGETEVTVSHEGLPARMHEEYMEGWTAALTKLKRLVESH